MQVQSPKLVRSGGLASMTMTMQLPYVARRREIRVFNAITMAGRDHPGSLLDVMLTIYREADEPPALYITLALELKA